MVHGVIRTDGSKAVIPDYHQFYSDFDLAQITSLLSGSTDDVLNCRFD